MGSFKYKELGMLPSGTPAYFMSKYYSPRTSSYLAKWQNLTKKNPRITMATRGMFQLDNIIPLRSRLKGKGSQIKQTE